MENYYDLSLIIRTIKSFGKISTSLSLRSLKLQLVVVGREGSRKLHKISNYSNYYTKNNSHYTSASAAIISGADGLITCSVFINAGIFEYNNSDNIN